MQSSSLRMKRSVIRTSCELQGLIPLSFCTRELQSFTLRISHAGCLAAIVQCASRGP